MVVDIAVLAFVVVVDIVVVTFVVVADIVVIVFVITVCCCDDCFCGGG